MNQDLYDGIETILQKHYPRFDFTRIKLDDLIAYMKRDKKRQGKDLTMILAQGIGRHLKLDDVQQDEIAETYNEFVSKYPANVGSVK